MPLYRGSGGAGDASTDAYASQIAQYAQTATTKANEASVSAAATAADLLLTNADVVLTHADVVLTNADAVSTALDVVSTNADAVATALDVVATNADAASTALDVIATNADVVATALDVVATNADVVASALSETNAASSASTATTQASNASTSAINAALSETAAQSAQTSAEIAQAAAEAAQSAINGFFLGAQASDPTLDLIGNAVTVGDWYFNTGDNTTRIYDGSVWNTVNPDLIGDGSPQLGGNLDLNGNNVTGTGNIDITGNALLTGNLLLPTNSIYDGTRGVKFHNTGNGASILADASETLTVKSIGNIVVNALSGEIKIKDGSSAFGAQLDLANDNHVSLTALIANKDIIFKGIDHDGVSGTSVTALTLDMSDAGKALFNSGASFGSGVTVTGTVAATTITSGGDTVLTTSSIIDGGTY
jgi:hypothetical protein